MLVPPLPHQPRSTRFVDGSERARACAKACRTVCTTLEEVQVTVGTLLCAIALVRSDVLMYTTWSARGVDAARSRNRAYAGA